MKLNLLKINFFKLLPILITLAIAVLLRGQEVFSNNYLFLIDQGRDMMKVKEIIYDHHPTLIGPYTSLGGVFQGPFYYYLISIPAFIFKGDPLGPLVLMLLISVSAMFIAFFWTNKFFGYKTALITFILFAVSPEAIAASTYTWNPHPMWFLITAFAFMLYEIAGGKKKYHLFLWAMVGLMFHFEMALGVFFLAATLIYMFVFQRKKAINKYFLAGLVIFGLFLLPQIMFDLRHDFLMSKSIIPLFSGSDQGLIVKGESTSYLKLLENHKGAFINNFNSAFAVSGSLKSFLPILFIISVFFFSFSKKTKILSRKEHLFITALAEITAIIIILTFFYPFPIRYWFLTGFQSLYILVAGILLSKLFNYGWGKVVLTIIFLSFSGFIIGKLNTLYFNPPDEGGTAKIKGKKEAIDYIYKDADGRPFGLLVFTPPVNTDAYDYLIWWYGNNKYNYLPYREKKGTFYLLIEIDSSKPWSYKGWLETVIKSGKVIETKTLPSGFVVQKRIEEN